MSCYHMMGWYDIHVLTPPDDNTETGLLHQPQSKLYHNHATPVTMSTLVWLKHNTNFIRMAKQEIWQPPSHQGSYYNRCFLPILAMDLQAITKFLLSSYHSNVTEVSTLLLRCLHCYWGVYIVKSICQMASAILSSFTITFTNPVVTLITDRAQSQPQQPSFASQNHTWNITYGAIPRISLQTEEINTRTCLPKEPIVCNWSLNFVLSSSSVSSISSASSSLPCNQNKTAEQTVSYSFSISCTRFPALRTHKCQKTYPYICKLNDHIMSQIVYMCLLHRYS